MTDINTIVLTTFCDTADKKDPALVVRANVRTFYLIKNSRVVKIVNKNDVSGLSYLVGYEGNRHDHDLTGIPNSVQNRFPIAMVCRLSFGTKTKL